MSSQMFAGTGTMADGPVITVGTVVILLMDDVPSWNPGARQTGKAVIIGVDNVLGQANQQQPPSVETDLLHRRGAGLSGWSHRSSQKGHRPGRRHGSGSG